MIIACVLKSGGEYNPHHAQMLLEEIKEHTNTSGTRLVCLSDLDRVGDWRVIKLRHRLPGWWSKLELLRPDIVGDIFYLDLDTVVLGDLAPLLAHDRLTLLRDFYRPDGLGSGLMYLPQRDRFDAWDAVQAQGFGAIMHRFRPENGEPWGDQAFFETLWLYSADRWQDVAPGAVCSYKADVMGRGVPDGARVVCYHGRPRPWERDYHGHIDLRGTQNRNRKLA